MFSKARPGFWKINNSVLNDDKFAQDLSSKIPEFKRKYNYLEDRGLYWDLLKMEVRGFCVQYTKRKNTERTNIEKVLQQKIDQINVMVYFQPGE